VTAPPSLTPAVIEDKRDDPDFGYRREHLERAVSCLIDALSMRQGRR
jgi:hypothetical protein